MAKYILNAWFNFLVCYLFGIFGIHKFFIEKNFKMGLIYLFTLGLFFIGWFLDCIKYLLTALKSPFTARKIKKISQAAELGIAKAQCDLGIMYIDGKGLKKDYKQGIFWLTKSAGQGWRDASYNLAMLHRYGIGFEKNIEKAIYWYKKANAQGLVIAAYDIGNLYYYGSEVTKDNHEAVKWLAVAANEGYPLALDKLKEYGLFAQYYDLYANETVRKDYTRFGNRNSSNSGYNFNRSNSVAKELDPYDEWMKDRNVTVTDRHGNPIAWNLTLEEAKSLYDIEEDPYT